MLQVLVIFIMNIHVPLFSRGLDYNNVLVPKVGTSGQIENRTDSNPETEVPAPLLEWYNNILNKNIQKFDNFTPRTDVPEDDSPDKLEDMDPEAFWIDVEYKVPDILMYLDTPEEKAKFGQYPDEITKNFLRNNVAPIPSLIMGLADIPTPQTIISMELHTFRKLIPVVLLGGVRAGKSRALRDLYHSWPAKSGKKIYTFNPEGLPDSVGGSLAATQIFKFNDIVVENTQETGSSFPALIVIDSIQLGVPDDMFVFLERCQWHKIKVVMSGVPSTMRAWAPIAFFKQSYIRTVLYARGECEVCGSIFPELSSQLGKKPAIRLHESLPEISHAIVTCIPCSNRFFPDQKPKIRN